MRQRARRGECCGKFSANLSVSLDRVPSEILLKIFSHLDAGTLLCTGCMTRSFYHLANDHFNWITVSSTAFSPKRSTWKIASAEKTAESMNLLLVKCKEAGYGKKESLRKRRAFAKATLAQVLQLVNPSTGRAVQTKEALRISGSGWVIMVKEKSGKESIMEGIDLSINDSTVTVTWYSQNWP